MKTDLPKESIMDNQSFGTSPTLIHQQLVPAKGMLQQNQGISNQNQTQNRPHTNQSSKYSMVDLVWLTNLKLKDPDLGKMEENEADLCIISYNTTYSNAQISLYDFTSKESASNYHVKLSMCHKLTQLSFGAESAIEMLFNMNISFHEPEIIPIVERVISTWKPNKSSFSVSNDEIVLETEFRNKKYSYTFLKWQIEALKKCLETSSSASSLFSGS